MYIRDHQDCNIVESMDRAEVLRQDCPWVSVVNLMAKSFAYAVKGDKEVRIDFYTKNGALRAVASPNF